MINEIIAQIGGRERLDNLASGNAFYCIQDDEGQLMARALLAVLDAQDKPVAWIVEFSEDEQEHRVLTLDKPERNYSDCSTPLYATPPAASEPVSKRYTLPDGYILVPIEPTWGMLSADGCSKHHDGHECSHHENRKRIWRAMLSAAPAPHK